MAECASKAGREGANALSVGSATCYARQASPAAKELISGLLDRKPERRLAAEHCKQHAFFSGVDWGKLARKEYAALVKVCRH